MARVSSRSNTEQQINDEQKSPVVETPVATPVQEKKVAARLKIEPTELVEVANNTRGILTYRSNRSMGYEITWSQPGDTELIEFAELVSMRNSQPAFFNRNWVIIYDEDILKALGVEKMYEAMLGIGKIDDLFKMTPSEIKEKMKKAPQGLKDNISLRAKELLAVNMLNDLNVIRALEDVLGYQILELKL